jgi:hypothetical protein
LDLVAPELGELELELVVLDSGLEEVFSEVEVFSEGFSEVSEGEVEEAEVEEELELELELEVILYLRNSYILFRGRCGWEIQHYTELELYSQQNDT